MQDKYDTNGRKLLQDWLKTRKFSVAAFARLANVHYRMAWVWVKGKYIPNLEHAVLIEKLTAIPPRAWTLPATVKDDTKNAAKKKKTKHSS